MTEPDQITEAEQLAVPVWMHQLASKIVLGNHGVGNAGVLIQRAFEERERELREALKAVEDEGLRNHNTRCRPWWNQVRQALATRQPTPTEGTSHDQ